MNLILFFVPLACGLFQAVQAMTNGAAARGGLGVLWAGALSAVTSAILLSSAAWLANGPFSAATFRAQGWKGVIGGALGAAILSGVAFAAPRLGPTQTFLLYLVALVAASLAIDSLGLFGAEAKPLQLKQVAGILVAAAGVALARS